MKIAVLSTDTQLMDSLKHQCLQEKNEFVLYTHPDLLLHDMTLSNIPFVIISDRFFDFRALSDYVDEIRQVEQTCRMIILLSNKHDSQQNAKFLKYCLAEGLDFIQPGRAIGMIENQIRECIYGKLPMHDGSRTGKIILFMGTTPNIGTTIISFGTAVRLALETPHRIGYLCLNLKSSKIHRYLGKDNPRLTLDHLRAEIRSKSLHPESLYQYCEHIKQVPQLSVLFGNMLREQAEFFTVEDIDFLLEIARLTFDICIVEVHAYWDNAATMSAMLQADSKLMVTTPDISHFQEDLQRWTKTIGPFFGLDCSSYDLIVTQMDKQTMSGGIRLRDIRKELDMNVLAEVNKYPELVSILNHGRILDLYLGQHPLVSNLSGLTHTLISLYGLQAVEHKETRKIRFKWPVFKEA